MENELLEPSGKRYRTPIEPSENLVTQTTSPAIMRAFEVMSRLPRNQTLFGAEIGVWRGYMSYVLLSNSWISIFMVDNWKGLDEKGYRPVDMMYAKARALKSTEFAGERRIIAQGDSVVIASKVRDGILDFVFIDGDHSYAGCKSDIEVWSPKVKAGGLISGHDYGNMDYAFGLEVKQIVDETCASNGWTLDLGYDTTWFARKK